MQVTPLYEEKMTCDSSLESVLIFCRPEVLRTFFWLW